MIYFCSRCGTRTNGKANIIYSRHTGMSYCVNEKKCNKRIADTAYKTIEFYAKEHSERRNQRAAGLR